MKRLFYIFIIIFLNFLNLEIKCTHNRAGEITYRHISGYTYEITLITYTYTLSPADRPELLIHWGDGTSSIIPRILKIELPDFYYKNVYKGTHTYPGPGVYRIYMEDQNRNEGVLNIPNSVEVPFALQAILNINPLFLENQTPILTYPPIDKAKLNTTFIHNPCAYDPDGDSLSYKLTICLGENGLPIPNYIFPYASDSLIVDPITGDLIWEKPQQTGFYNVAMIIEEWRYIKENKKYLKIGEIYRDIQIEVYEANNEPPFIDYLKNLCVWANDTVKFNVYATDLQNDKIILSAYGGPFHTQPSAIFDSIIGFPPIYQTFSWATNCSHVKKFPYLVVFKAKDLNDELSLVFQRKVYIQVICPPIDSLKLFPTSSTITLQWNKTICSNASHYEIYRRINPSNWTPDSCTTGIPISLGYTLIHSTSSINDTIFIDTDNGQGLKQGYTYCYRIVVVFNDEAKSIASKEICTELIKGIPVITHASILKTDENNGKIYVEWSKPTEFDTSLATGPYLYKIYRSPDSWGTNFTYITTNHDINDTTLIDSLVNTIYTPYSYKIELYNNQPNNTFLIGSPSIASTIFLKTNTGNKKIILNWFSNTPWLDTLYVIYRLNENTNEFDSIGFSYSNTFTDTGLINLKEYCYKIKAYGIYLTGRYNMPFINYSQEVCDTPKDTTPPCAPNLFAKSLCKDYKNIIKWNKPDSTCANDVIAYRLYYTHDLNKEFQLLTEIKNLNDTFFIHTPNYSLGTCYILTLVDSFYNESPRNHMTCIDECKYYELPNIFTPDENHMNDIFRPGPYKFVEKVNMQIFNRWGRLVFQTNNPDILWDGTDMETKKRVPDGVYYYICDVYERRITGIEIRNLTGFIYVISPKTKKEP